MTTIFQSELLTNFLYPFLLMFFIVFAVLEKTNVLGSDKKQLNALVSLVIGLIFIGAVFPKIMVENMILFMTVGLVIIFVVLMLWGFVSGETPTPGTKWKKFYAVLLGIAVVVAVIWASGIGGAFVNGLQGILTFLFDSKWSNTFWSNVLFVALVAGAIAVVLKSKAKAEGSS
jgi:hypothetical protein